jgi:DNA polymerase delta subunit 1
MPGAVVKTPAKRVLTEATNTRQNIAPSHIHSAKKRKLEVSSNGLKLPGADANSGKSQPKSDFEEQLEKLSQGMNGLKENNSERDQHWARPSLAEFDDVKNSLCFQQIDVEEGTLSGGKQTIRLFGVTEVCCLRALS